MNDFIVYKIYPLIYSKIRTTADKFYSICNVSVISTLCISQMRLVAIYFYKLKRRIK